MTDSVQCVGEKKPHTAGLSAQEAFQLRVEKQTRCRVFSPRKPLDVEILVCAKINQRPEIFHDYGRGAYNLTVGRLWMRSGVAPLPLARRMVWFLLHHADNRRWSYKALGRRYGYAHTTVCNGCKQCVDGYCCLAGTNIPL